MCAAGACCYRTSMVDTAEFEKQQGTGEEQPDELFADYFDVDRHHVVVEERWEEAERIRALLADGAASGTLHTETFSGPRELQRLSEGITDLCVALRQEVRHAIVRIVTTEALTNGISRRGPDGVRLTLNSKKEKIDADPAGYYQDVETHVGIDGSEGRGDLLFSVRDTGPGFNPHRVDNPLKLDNMERDYGRGILVMADNGRTVGAGLTYLPMEPVGEDRAVRTNHLLMRFQTGRDPQAARDIFDAWLEDYRKRPLPPADSGASLETPMDI